MFTYSTFMGHFTCTRYCEVGSKKVSISLGRSFGSYVQERQGSTMSETWTKTVDKEEEEVMSSWRDQGMLPRGREN